MKKNEILQIKKDQSANVKKDKIISLQYLRGLAVVLVLSQHTLSYFGGAQGVDIFFIISGFIMMYIIGTTNQTASGFFLARFFRIAPSYYIVSVIYFLFGLAQNPTFSHFLYSFLFLKIKYPEPILTVGWTLNYEFILYFFCAFSILFFSKNRYRYIFIAAVLFIITLVKDIWFDLIVGRGFMSGYFLEFLFGILIYHLWKIYKPVKNKFLVFYIISIFFSLFFLAYNAQFIFQHYNGNLPFRFFFYGLPGFFLVFFCLLIEKQEKIPKISSLIFLGDASYSIYLTHPIVTGLGIIMFDEFKSAHQYAFGGLLLIVSLVVGFMFYILVEKKMNIYFKIKISNLGEKFALKKLAKHTVIHSP
jgi:exopolysaccharide production protein ExoZ